MVAVALSPEVRPLALPPLNVQEHIQQLKAAARAEVAKGANGETEGIARKDENGGDAEESRKNGNNAAAARPAYLPPPEVAKTIPCRYFPSCTYGSACMFYHPDGSASQPQNSQDESKLAEQTQQNGLSASSLDPAPSSSPVNANTNGQMTSSSSPNPYTDYPSAAQAHGLHPAAMGYYTMPYEVVTSGNGANGELPHDSHLAEQQHQHQYMQYVAAQQAAAYGYAQQGYAHYPGSAQHHPQMHQYQSHHPYAPGHAYSPPQQMYATQAAQQNATSPTFPNAPLLAPTSSAKASNNGQQEIPSDPAIVHQQRSSVSHPIDSSSPPAVEASATSAPQEINSGKDSNNVDYRSLSPHAQNGQFADPMSPSAASQPIHAYIPPTGYYPMVVPEMMHPHHQQQYMYSGVPAQYAMQSQQTKGDVSRSSAQTQLDAEFAKASLSSANRSSPEGQRAASSDLSSTTAATVQHAKHARLPSLHTFFQTTGETGATGHSNPVSSSSIAATSNGPRSGPPNSTYPRRLSSSVPPSGKRPFSSATGRGPPPPYKTFPPQDARSVCSFFYRGICKFGDSCHLVHVLNDGKGDARALKSRIINPQGDVATDAAGERPTFATHRQPFRTNPHHNQHLASNPALQEARYQARFAAQQQGGQPAQQQQNGQDEATTAVNPLDVTNSHQAGSESQDTQSTKLEGQVSQEAETGNVNVQKVEKLISETRNLPAYEKAASPAGEPNNTNTTQAAPLPGAPRASSQPAPATRNGPSSNAPTAHPRRGVPQGSHVARHHQINGHAPSAQRVPNGENDFPALKIPASSSGSTTSAMERSSSSGAETSISSARATNPSVSSSAASSVAAAESTKATAPSTTSETVGSTSPSAAVSVSTAQKTAFSWASAAAKAASLPDPPKRSISKARPVSSATQQAQVLATPAPSATAPVTPAINEAVSTLDKEAAAPAAIKA